MAADRTLAIGIDSRQAVRGYRDGTRAADKFTGAARKSVQQTNNLDSSFDRTARRARSFATALGGLAALIGAGRMARGLVNINREFQRLQAQLHTTEGSAEAAADAFARIEELAITTPFEIEELTQAFVQLRVRGAQPTNEEFLALGDLSSSFSRNITEVAGAVSSATAGMARPLRSLGIEASIAGDQITLSFQGAETTVERSAGAIVSAIAEITGGRLGGAMEREMRTINGAVSNLFDSIGKLARLIGESGGLNDAIGKMVRRLDEGVNTLAENRTVVLAAVDAFVALVQAMGLAAGVGLAWAAAQVALNIGGATAAFLSLIPAVNSVAAALALLQVAMGPVGWIVTGVTAIAGALFLWRRRQREVNEGLEKTRRRAEAAQGPLEAHAEALARMRSAGFGATPGVPDADPIPRPAAPTGAGLIEVQRERIELLRRGLELEALTNAEREELLGVENQIKDILKSGVGDLERRLALVELLGEEFEGLEDNVLTVAEAVEMIDFRRIEQEIRSVKSLIDEAAQESVPELNEAINITLFEDLRGISESYRRAALEGARGTDEAAEAERERIQVLREQARTFEENTRAALRFAEAIGVMSSEAARTAEDIVTLSASVARIAGGDLSALPAAIASAGSVISSLFGDSEAEQRAQEMQQALEDLTRQIESMSEQLRKSGQTRAQGAVGDVAQGFQSMIQAFAKAFPDAFPWETLADTFAREVFERGNTPEAFLEWLNFIGQAVLESGNAEAIREWTKILDLAAKAAAQLQNEMRKAEEAFMRNLDVRRLEAQGLTDQAEALRIQIQQEEELAAAREQGFSDAAIAALEVVQAEEDLARARQKAAEQARQFAELEARALDLIGRSGAAQRTRLGIRQQQEQLDAEGQPRQFQDLLDAVHAVERINLEESIAIAEVERNTQAQLDALGRQEQALGDQLRVSQDQLREQERIVATNARIVRSLSDFQDSLLLGPLTTLSPTQQLEEARSQFTALRDLALGGDATAAESLPDAARAFLEASREVNASGLDFVGDFRSVMESLAAVEDRFAGRMSVDERILAELQGQTGQLQQQINRLEQQRSAIQSAAQQQIAAIQAQFAEERQFYQDIIEQLLGLNRTIRTIIPPPGPGGGTPNIPLNNVQAQNNNVQAAGFQQTVQRLDQVVERLGNIEREIRLQPERV